MAMNPLTARRRRYIADEQLTVALARQLGSMQLASKGTQVGIQEIAAVHRYASDIVALQLAIVDQMVKAATYAGRITPAKERELQRRTEEYLQETLGISQDASRAILDILSDR